MTRKYNPKSSIFGDIAGKLKSLFPQQNLKLGIHTSGSSLYKIGYIKDENMSPISASVELVGGSVNLRMYRVGSGGPTYKIDTISGVDKGLSYIVPKSEFDHYIYTNIPENIMGRNNISIKFDVDKNGNFVPKVDENGMLEAFINFPDPTEEILKRAKKRNTN